MSKESRQMGREMRQALRQRHESTEEETTDTFIVMIVVGVVVVAAVLGGLGWVDDQFGWHLKDTVVSWFTSL